MAHTLTGGGFDAGEDGTGRGTPIVPILANGNEGANGAGIGDIGDPSFPLQSTVAQAIAFDTTQITSKENRCQPEAGGPCHPLPAHGHAPALAFSCKDYGADVHEDRSPTLRAMGHDGSHANAGGQLAVAFDARQSDVIQYGDISGPLDTDAEGVGVQQSWAVRRLTPMECERLQGFPDRYTAVPYRGKTAADGPRYKALGNSMATNCMSWIGQRIALFEIAVRPA